MTEFSFLGTINQHPKFIRKEDGQFLSNIYRYVSNHRASNTAHTYVNYGNDNGAQTSKFISADVWIQWNKAIRSLHLKPSW